MRTVLAESRLFGQKSALFKLKEVKGARRITVRVTHEGVVVTKPRWVSRRQVELFVAGLHEWLETELGKWEDRLAQTLSDTVLYLGEEVRIRPASTAPVRLAGGEFWSFGDTPHERLEAVLDWMRKRARRALRESVALWAPRMGVEPKRVSVRDQVSCWGSCSSSGGLSFNWRLVMAPPPVLEYIVIHELAHIEHHNHSRPFWSLVEKHCPDYQVHERWLKENTDRVMLAGRAGAHLAPPEVLSRTIEQTL